MTTRKLTIRRLPGSIVTICALLGGALAAQTASAIPVCGITKLQMAQLEIDRASGELSLPGGQKIKLAGLHVPVGKLPELRIEILSSSAKYLISFAGKKPDRYDRRSAYLYQAGRSQGDLILLQADILRQGQALARPEDDRENCNNLLFEAETTARKQSLGLWAKQKNWISSANDVGLVEKTNQFHIVEGRIVSVGETRRTIYLNFGRTWKTDFTVSIAKRDAKRFKGKIELFKSLSGQLVRVRGWMQLKDGGLIKLIHAGQIEFEPK